MTPEEERARAAHPTARAVRRLYCEKCERSRQFWIVTVGRITAASCATCAHSITVAERRR